MMSKSKKKGENEMLFSFSMGLLVAIVVDLLLGGKHLVAAAIPGCLTFFILIRSGWGVTAEKWLNSLEDDKRNLVPLAIIIVAIVAGVLGLAYFTR